MTLPRHGALIRAKNSSVTADDRSPAWHIWNLLNPNEDPLVHLRIEMPVILTFRPHGVGEDQLADKAERLRSVRTIRLAFWILKIVVLPITATTGLLYRLLLYLLKNTELLEAQRNRPGEDSPTREEQSKLEGQISFTTLPRVFATDVELIAASKDGGIVAAVGVQNEVTIWRMVNHSHICIDTTDLLLRTASTSSAPSALTAVAVDADGKFCAVGSGTGMIAIWVISEGFVQPLPHLKLANSTSGVTELEFISKPSSRSNQSSVSAIDTTESICLLAIYGSGVAAKWNVGTNSHVTYITPSHPCSVIKSMSLRVEADERLIVAHAMQDGIVELSEIQEFGSLLTPGFYIQAGSFNDPVSTVHACRAELGSRSRLIIGVTTEAGVVSIWDASTNECIYTLDEPFGEVSGFRLSPIPCKTCHYCGELPLESFSISISVGHVVFIYKAYIPVQTRRCACAGRPRQVVAPSRGRRSRSGSTVSSVTPSPLISRAKLQPVLDTSPFPVSGHGVHSRRASEKDPLRRMSDVLAVPPSMDEHEPSQSSGALDTQGSSFNSRGSIWQNLLIVRAADATCEKGSWNISNHKIVGVRRKLRRPQGRSKDPATTSQVLQGLTAATLERWELWTFDPLTLRLQSSPLISLVVKHAVTSIASSTSPAKDYVPRLPFTHAFPFLISGSNGLVGFGNTVGVFNFSSA